MLKIFLRAVIIGTLIFIALLGLGLVGLRPAFELAIVFSIPSIYIVGPLMNYFPYDWFEGPPSGVAVILISSWLELTVISVFVGVIWNIKARTSDEKHQGN